MEENLVNVAVVDSFDIRADTPGSLHSPGLVVMIDGRQCGFQLPAIGDSVEFRRPDGDIKVGQVEEIKDHGDGRSLFFPALARVDVPVGSVMSWRLKSRFSIAQSSQALVEH